MRISLHTLRKIVHRACHWKKYHSKIRKINPNLYLSAIYLNYRQNWLHRSYNNPRMNHSQISRKRTKFHQCNPKIIAHCCLNLNAAHSKTTLSPQQSIESNLTIHNIQKRKEMCYLQAQTSEHSTNHTHQQNQSTPKTLRVASTTKPHNSSIRD